MDSIEIPLQDRACTHYMRQSLKTELREFDGGNLRGVKYQENTLAEVKLFKGGESTISLNLGPIKESIRRNVRLLNNDLRESNKACFVAITSSLVTERIDKAIRLLKISDESLFRSKFLEYGLEIHFDESLNYAIECLAKLDKVDEERLLEFTNTE